MGFSDEEFDMAVDQSVARDTAVRVEHKVKMLFLEVMEQQERLQKMENLVREIAERFTK